ncbi:MAG: response regulator [Candidatus Doudnabacteria bacterium]|nr:response regulator [bacterium]MDZ4244280.1 response regulator [Candidatus Doudnabacteria bacterium]
MNTKQILIVEDDPGIVELIKTILESEGYAVWICDKGEMVLEKTKEISPALIFLDLWIPGEMDGAKVTRLLKADEQTRNIPVVIVSAHNDLAEIAREVGAADFLAKPFDLKALLMLAQRYAVH